MGGDGSGRRPSVETLIKQSQPVITPIGDSLFIPNYSGIKSEAIKINEGKLLTTEYDPVFMSLSGSIATYAKQAEFNSLSGSFVSLSGSYVILSGSYATTSGAYIAHAADGTIHFLSGAIWTAINANTLSGATSYAHSQNNSQAHTDYMLNTGDIGAGDYTFKNASTHTQFSIDTPATNKVANLNILSNGTQKWGFSSRGTIDSPNDRLTFSDASGVIMTYEQGGNIGIGGVPSTIAGGSRLAVKGGTETSRIVESIIASGSGLGSKLHFADAATYNFAIGTVDTSGDFVFSSASYPNAGSGSLGTERMRIMQGGNVGIGTTAPDQHLTVSGTVGLANHAAPTLTLTASSGAMFVSGGALWYKGSAATQTLLGAA